MPELDDAALERRLRGVLQEHLGALPLDLTVETLDRRREAKGLPRRSGRGRSMTLLAAAALLLVGGALAAGSGLLRLPSVVPPVPAPSVVAVATTSPDATSPSPSMLASPTPVPSATPAPITWTEASLKEDWPAPVRTEPAGGARVEPIQDDGFRKADPVGDTGSDDFPWVDIQEVGVFAHVVQFTLPEFPPDVDPTEQWIAYGVVFDDDHDGVPDRRVGWENTPRTEAEGWDRYEVWITDLHTGRTTHQEGDHVGETYVNAAPGRFSFGHDTPTQARNGGGWIGTSLVNRPLYVWASVIQDGRVVATDYAPDEGWLARSADARP